jgi:hypothetical protein
MSDTMLELVTESIRDAFTEAELGNPRIKFEELTDILARAAIEAIPLEQWIMRAYVRGAEWNEENPLDRKYRFKAAGDYADKLLSEAQSTGEKK